MRLDLQTSLTSQEAVLWLILAHSLWCSVDVSLQRWVKRAPPTMNSLLFSFSHIWFKKFWNLLMFLTKSIVLPQFCPHKPSSTTTQGYGLKWNLIRQGWLISMEGLHFSEEEGRRSARGEQGSEKEWPGKEEGGEAVIRT